MGQKNSNIIRERLRIFICHHINNQSLYDMMTYSDMEILENFFLPIISTKYWQGEPIIGKYSCIHSPSFQEILKSGRKF